MKLPKARTRNLLEQNLKYETMIYDLTTNKAFHLNETLSAVYQACGQNQTFDELKRESKFTDDFIHLALDELKRNNLLADEYDSPFKSTSRREVIKKVGLATMFTLPLITALSAPIAARAASGSSQCQTNVCYASGFALCNACPGRPRVQFYNSKDGTCVKKGVGPVFSNCTPGQYTVADVTVLSAS
jgi:hypothetical protein